MTDLSPVQASALPVPASGIGPGTAPAAPRGRARRILGWARRDIPAAVGAVVLVVIVLAALLAPWAAPFPGDGTHATHPLDTLAGPGAQHWFGTDGVGRDLLTRVLYGARTSLTVAGVVLALAALIGVPLGVVAGYAGGVVKDVIMRITDVFLAFPALLLSVALAAVLHAGTGSAIIAISVGWWPWYARMSCVAATTIRHRGFVDAARCLGVTRTRIVLRHVLPNAVTPVLVQLSLDAGGVILTSAALSYLGLGPQEPTAEWGLMAQQGQDLFITDWWLVAFPGAAILLTAFCFNVLGEGLRSALDPHRELTR